MRNKPSINVERDADGYGVTKDVNASLYGRTKRESIACLQDKQRVIKDAGNMHVVDGGTASNVPGDEDVRVRCRALHVQARIVRAYQVEVARNVLRLIAFSAACIGGVDDSMRVASRGAQVLRGVKKKMSKGDGGESGDGDEQEDELELSKMSGDFSLQVNSLIGVYTKKCPDLNAESQWSNFECLVCNVTEDEVGDKDGAEGRRERCRGEMG
ncbi:hypothetical protein C8R45DRAFT_1185108 [Mycena sanguinolenta]|nr:hypothetical protein C8R45DRAFT_1185108 [Mycena sanguinolenta]